MTVNGIDVASYQPTAYDTAGLSFVFVKATEGTGYANPNHTGQVATARAHGLVTGHYHFVRPGDTAAQVAYFLANASPKPGDILALDWEDTGVSNAAKDAWIKACQKAAPGNRVLLYCNLDFWQHRDISEFCGDGLWIADPGGAPGHPRIDHNWVLHQYSETSGIDHNVANFADKAALQAWALKQPVPGPLDPTPPMPPMPPMPPSLEDEMPNFTVTSGPAGVTFPRGSARTIGFFTDNTLLGGPADKGAMLRVVVWASGIAPSVHEVTVSNKSAQQTVITFANAALTHSITVTRADGGTYPVFAEVS